MTRYKQKKTAWKNLHKWTYYLQIFLKNINKNIMTTNRKETAWKNLHKWIYYLQIFLKKKKNDYKPKKTVWKNLHKWTYYLQIILNFSDIGM